MGSGPSDASAHRTRSWHPRKSDGTLEARERVGAFFKPRPSARAIGRTRYGLLYSVAHHHHHHHHVAAPADLGGSVHQALVVAVAAVHGVATVAVLGVEDVVAAVAVKDVAVGPEGGGVDAVSVAQTFYLVWDAFAAALAEGVARSVPKQGSLEHCLSTARATGANITAISAATPRTVSILRIS